eukprot:g44381.t1
MCQRHISKPTQISFSRKQLILIYLFQNIEHCSWLIVGAKEKGTPTTLASPSLDLSFVSSRLDNNIADSPPFSDRILYNNPSPRTSGASSQSTIPLTVYDHSGLTQPDATFVPWVVFVDPRRIATKN